MALPSSEVLKKKRSFRQGHERCFGVELDSVSSHLERPRCPIRIDVYTPNRFPVLPASITPCAASEAAALTKSLPDAYIVRTAGSNLIVRECSAFQRPRCVDPQIAHSSSPAPVGSVRLLSRFYGYPRRAAAVLLAPQRFRIIPLRQVPHLRPPIPPTAFSRSPPRFCFGLFCLGGGGVVWGGGGVCVLVVYCFEWWGW